MHRVLKASAFAILVLALVATTVHAAIIAPVQPIPRFTINAGAESLDSIADINGDGRRDLILGNPNSNLVQLRSGTNGALLGTINAPAGFCGFGHDVASIGDVDGDGLEDVLIGAPDCVGQAFIYSSATLLPLRNWGPSSGTGGGLYGTAVARAGNLNGTGTEEVIVSAPLFNTGGSSSHIGLVEVIDVVLPSTAVVATITGTANYEEFGDSLAYMGDTNGDGVDDFAVGSTRFFGAGGTVCQPFNQVGMAQVFSGATFLPLVTSFGTGPADTYGFAVAAADLSNNGVNNLIVGAPDFCPLTTPTVYTDTGLVIPTPTNVCRHFGWAVSGVGNIKGTAYDEFVVGAPVVFGGCGLAGRAYVYNGRNGVLLWTLSVSGASATFGHDVTELEVVGALNYFAVADPGANRVHVYGI